MNNTLIIITLLPAIAYLMGAIPFGLVIVRCVSKTDIRRIGSGNIGATNVRRAAGTGWAIAALAGDVLKGALPTLAAVYFQGPTGSNVLPSLVTLAAISGHMFPVYLKFKPSGKGVATALGCFCITAPIACITALLAFVASVYRWRRVSLGSLTGIAILPPTIWFNTQNLFLTAGGIVAMALIIARHKENLQRLAQGKEPTIDG